MCNPFIGHFDSFRDDEHGSTSSNLTLKSTLSPVEIATKHGNSHLPQKRITQPARFPVARIDPSTCGAGVIRKSGCNDHAMPIRI